jgi:CheY-like chemotaxis protein
MDAPSGKSPPVVLVVEDDPLLRMLAVEVVEEVGFVALQAGRRGRSGCSAGSPLGHFSAVHGHRYWPN